MHSIIGKSAVVLGTVLWASLGAGPAWAQDGFKVTSLTLFSVQGRENPAITPIEPGDTIPYRVEESCYGWFLEFEPVDGPVVLQEVLSIPAPAEHWGTADESNVADDRKSARTTVRVDGREGSAQNVWCVAEGDPEGIYSFRIWQDGAPVAIQLPFRIERQ